MAELTEKYGKDKARVELVPGGGGIFDVVVDGKLIYSKHETGRFPAYGEVTGLIDEKLVRD